MPQMSPCSWFSLILISNLMIKFIKVTIFFEKKF